MSKLRKMLIAAVTTGIALVFGIAALSFVSHRAPWRLEEAAVIVSAAVILVALLALHLARRLVWVVGLWVLMVVSTVGVLRIHAESRIPTIWSDFDLLATGRLEAGDPAAARGELWAYYTRAPRRFAATFTDHSAQEAKARADQWLTGRVKLGRAPAFDLPEDLTWSEDPFDGPQFPYQLHTMPYVSDLSRTYEATGDLRYLERAQTLVLDWLDDNQRNLWRIGDPNPKYSWHDHTTAIRLRHWLVFWEVWRRSPLIKPETMEVFLQGLLRHVHLLVSPDFYTRAHNHGLDQDLAVIATTSVLPELWHAEHWLDLATTRLGEQIAATIWPSGVHMEHSPGYHHYTMQILAAALRFGEAHGMPFLEDLDLAGVLTRMGEVLAQMMLPDRRLPQIGDTQPQDPLDLADPSLRDLAKLQPLLAYVLSDGTQGAPGESLARVYEAEGYAILRDTWSVEQADRIHLMLTAASNPGRGHKHDDDLSLTLFGLGRRLLVDSGSYQYLYGTPGRKFAVSARAHNTVVVDRGSFLGRDPELERWGGASTLGHVTEIESWRDEGALAAVTASHGNWPDIRHQRTLIYSRPHRVLVVDQLSPKADTPASDHLFEQLWHFDQGVEVRIERDQTILLDSRTGEQLLRLVQLEAGRDSGQVVRGQRDPMQGWITTYDGDLAAAPVAVFTERGREALFVTQIDVGAGASAEAARSLPLRREPGVLWIDLEGADASGRAIRVPLETRERME